jgi:uncharacterized protein YxjI
MPSGNLPSFFEHDDYIIDEKISGFKFTNAYRVYDANGTEIGAIQQRMSGGQKLLRMLVDKRMLPFILEILDEQGNVLATVKRGTTLFFSKISVLDAQGQGIARILQKFSILKPRFELTDHLGQTIGAIAGDWKGWNFVITDASGQEIGAINKKWNGAMKELFTTADKYHVSIHPEVAEDAAKIVIVAAAITVDMVLKESN